MKNRWLQLGASLVAMIMIANLQYAWTLFVEPIRAATGWKLSEIQWGFTLFIVFETWVMPLEGWLIDRMGPRIFTTIAGVLCGVGWSGLAFATERWQLYAYYALAGVGAAFVYSGSIASALKWFPDRRGLASGIIAGGFGAGSALFIPAIAAIIHAQGYRTAFVVTGIGQGVAIMLVAQLLRHPDREFAASHVARKKVAARVRRNAAQFSTPEMLRTPQFYLLYGMLVMMATGGLLVTAQAGPVAREWGISIGALTAALSLDRISNGASRIAWGWVSDRIGRELTMAIAFALQAACLVSVLTIGRQSGAMFTVTLVATFFTWGEVFALFPSVIGDYFGADHASSNYSFLYSAKGVASIIGGGLAAKLAESFGSWGAAFYGSAALALISSALALVLWRAPLPGKREIAEAARVSS
ncbi:MAG TPA: oxalate/formate MFS antiporter [Bryobacteraceae bacterium]|nr:oxalate/formate MFS antiporter [Bryobacteraceae bacterium]